jgi:hypothetical protein
MDHSETLLAWNRMQIKVKEGFVLVFFNFNFNKCFHTFRFLWAWKKKSIYLELETGKNIHFPPTSTDLLYIY